MLRGHSRKFNATMKQTNKQTNKQTIWMKILEISSILSRLGKSAFSKNIDASKKRTNA